MFIFKKKLSGFINGLYKSQISTIVLKGSTLIPGDKSISQRALIIGLISIGQTKIEGILDSEDVFFTMKAVQALGASIQIDKSNKVLTITGVGIGNLKSPKKPIYMGNSGTGVRLLIGLVAGSNATVTFYGDKSLSNRPMDRVIDPLMKMGAIFTCAEEKKLPITVIGARKKGLTMPIKYKLPVASAQIKSAIIFAGLSARGQTSIIEPFKSRSYTEQMLKKCGVNILSTIKNKTIHSVKVSGVKHLKGTNFIIPGDPSSAAFLVVASLISKGSKVTIRNVLYDKMRLQIFKVLQRMGGKISLNKVSNNKCNIEVHYSNLRNVELKRSDATSLIDEFPILSIAAACGKGKMLMKGLGELRVKESDRFKGISEGLKKCGVDVNTYGDDIEIIGQKKIKGNVNIDANDDHRIAMAFNILNLAADKPIKVIGNKSIKTSFPSFFETFELLKR